MNRLAFQSIDTILCLGAHADDIEIGCGGTLLTLGANRPGAKVYWVVLSAGGERREEARRSAEAFTAAFAGREIVLGEFRDGFLPYDGGAAKDFFENLKQTIRPDLIFTHHGRDLHQDHRLVAELTWNTWRDHFILEYEIPKYDGDLGAPNVFVPLDDHGVRTKCRFLQQYFQTQSPKPWFDDDTFRGLARIRGIECNSPTGFAEGFYGRKITLDPLGTTP